MCKYSLICCDRPHSLQYLLIVTGSTSIFHWQGLNSGNVSFATSNTLLVWYIDLEIEYYVPENDDTHWLGRGALERPATYNNHSNDLSSEAFYNNNYSKLTTYVTRLSQL